jgi:hypothetical protein
MLRYKLWGENTDQPEDYPDIGVFTTTVQASASTDPWEVAVDKYSFINGRQEYAFDIYQDQVDSNGNSIENSVYIVFNTPPFTAQSIASITYGTINPLVDVHGLQPLRDNQEDFQRSLFGFEQWLNNESFIRSKRTPHRFLLAFPGVMTDFSVTEAGFLRESRSDYWTTPPPYSPTVVEHDVIIRESNGQRYQVVNYTPIYLEDILVSQHFDMAELDPRSSIYNLEYATC